MHEIGCSGLVYWDDPEGWDKEGGGREIQDGTPMADSCQRMAKPIQYCKVKNKEIKLKKKKRKKKETPILWLLDVKR